MIDPGRTSRSAEEGPGEGEISTGALAFPGVPGMSGGTPVTIISGLPNQAKGAQTAENSYVFGPSGRRPLWLGPLSRLWRATRRVSSRFSWRE